MSIPYDLETVFDACVETGAVNGLEEFYLRPVVYRGYGQVGVNPVDCPIDMAIAVWKWGKYLGTDALEKGVDVRVSSWTRPAPNTFPSMAKSGANYMNSQLIKLEAGMDGYAEGIALGTDGFVSEGSGENLFVIYRGELYTPPISASILPGVTRETVLTFAREMEIPIHIESVPREMLYVADELFFSGTATEVTPIRTVDRITIGNGTRGPLTERFQKEFFRSVRGENPDHISWLTPVPAAKTAPVLEKTRTR
jgi:branched-chain amino acid aminotransferase